MKLFASLTFALFATLSAACVGAPEEIDAADDAEVALEDVDPAASEAAGGELSSDPAEQDLSCPTPGMCESANIACQQPPSYWCDIWTRCLECEPTE